MTDADKAFELLNKLDFEDGKFEITDALVAMAEWKKHQLFQRVAEFISKRFYIGINNQVSSRGNYFSLTELIRDLEKSMEGE